MHSVVHLLKSTTFPSVKRLSLETIQVNLGYLCNQSCTHCHVNAGPNRTELMQDEQIDQLITLMNQGWVKKLDLTGGAPEMNPRFKRLVVAARKAGVHVIVFRHRVHLRFAPETAKSAGKHDAVVILVKIGAPKLVGGGIGVTQPVG